MREKTRLFFFFLEKSLFFSREARLSFRERHGRALARVTAVPPWKRKKHVFCFFFFRESHSFSSARGTVVLSRESRPCLSEREKQNAFSVAFFFRESHGFASARGTVVLSQESRPCLSEREKQNTFSVFFLLRESRFCFRKRHGCAFVRVTAVPLGKEKNTFSIFFLLGESRFCFRKRHGCA